MRACGRDGDGWVEGASATQGPADCGHVSTRGKFRSDGDRHGVQSLEVAEAGEEAAVSGASGYARQIFDGTAVPDGPVR
jgi:hypothetical protein